MKYDTKQDNGYLIEDRPSWVFPPAIYELFESGDITGEEMLLLGKIASLHDSQAGGCWASNKFLAAFWRKTLRYVQKALVKFEKLGLIQKFQHEEKRIIVCLFNGSHLRNTPLSCKTSPRVAQDIPPMSYKTPKYSYYTSYNTHLKKSTVASRSAETATGGFFENFDGNIPQWIKDVAHKLYTFLSQKNKITRKPHWKTWYKEFQILFQEVEENKKRIKKAVRLYTTQPHTQFTPVVCSAKSFREKFISIERWISTIEEGESPVKITSEIIR